MSILEDNKVLADFMGYETSIWAKGVEGAPNGFEYALYYYPGEVINHTIARVEYQPHKDWNQLMESVEKIEKEQTTVSITGKSCAIKKWNIHGGSDLIVYKDSNTKHEAVYQAVLEYIKQQKED